MRERHDEPDRPMSAHAQIADVVEEDHARRALLVIRLAQQRADDHFGTAWLGDDARAPVVEARAKHVEPLRKRAAAEIGATGHDEAGWLTARVRIDYVQGFHDAHGRNAAPRSLETAARGL
jgi:hypothetical protein